MKKLLIGMVLMAGSLLAETHFSIGIGIGVPVTPRPYYYERPPVYGYPAYVAPAYPPPGYYAPPCPGPGYTWVPASWYWVRGHRYSPPGYWAAPARFYRGPRWRHH